MKQRDISRLVREYILDYGPKAQTRLEEDFCDCPAWLELIHDELDYWVPILSTIHAEHEPHGPEHL